MKVRLKDVLRECKRRGISFEINKNLTRKISNELDKIMQDLEKVQNRIGDLQAVVVNNKEIMKSAMGNRLNESLRKAYGLYDNVLREVGKSDEIIHVMERENNR